MNSRNDSIAERWRLLWEKYHRSYFIFSLTVLTVALTVVLFSLKGSIILEDAVAVLWMMLFFFYSDKLLFLVMTRVRREKILQRLRYMLNESPLFIWSIISLILFSLVLIIIEAVCRLSTPMASFFRAIDDAVLVILLLEYYLRYLSAGDDKIKFITSSESLIDLLALFPLLRAFRLMRFIRLLRFLRIAKFRKYLQTLAESTKYLAALWSENVFNFMIIVILSIVFLFFGTITIFHLEHHREPFRHFHDALWWSISLLFAGQPLDITTPGSRIIGVILMLSGVVITSILTGTVAATLSERLQSVKSGNINYSFRDHVVICGWRDQAADLIGYLHSHMGKRKRHILVIDDSIEALPLLGRDVFFVRGSPLNESVLLRANVPYAAAVIVLSGTTQGLYADERAILATLAVESISRTRMGRDIHTCSELFNAANMRNLERAYVNEIILIDDEADDILAQSAIIPDLVDVMNELLTNEKGENNLYKIMSYSFVGKHFGEIYLELSDKNIIPLAVLSEEVKTDREGVPLVDELGIMEFTCRTTVNPPGSYVITPHDRIFVIARPEDIRGWEVMRE
ncbi:MAG: NAD-binding protein [Candidatus Eremiobacteraeota bacterium]|nr:NAD-binding protein [Candidatus Eremiobacteraeota bacterium]